MQFTLAYAVEYALTTLERHGVGPRQTSTTRPKGAPLVCGENVRALRSATLNLQGLYMAPCLLPEAHQKGP